MYAFRPTLSLTIICVLVGFITGFGTAQFKISGYESIGSLASVLAISVATYLPRSRGVIGGMRALGVAALIYIAYVVAAVIGVVAVRLLRI